jgi:hypothetical protein
MNLSEQIKRQLETLPPEQQSEVLDFIAFLQQQAGLPYPAERRSLKQHPAFGSWKGRGIDAVNYQQTLRAEWDAQA